MAPYEKVASEFKRLTPAECHRWYDALTTRKTATGRSRSLGHYPLQAAHEIVLQHVPDSQKKKYNLAHPSPFPDNLNTTTRPEKDLATLPIPETERKLYRRIREALVAHPGYHKASKSRKTLMTSELDNYVNDTFQDRCAVRIPGWNNQYQFSGSNRPPVIK
ncbi:hypothetical protein LTS07_002161 [Exophiala sideris]|uniref:Uncharacterized protein n=1 Tax=Exophiala sideris TaxID=1016849 RepID=A0ABR0JLI2_9EURO|nr:hypothetical protein LTS07_002161 [Exophiala sideris]KAK5066817.1 hypothetical protein LTR69_002165 [Exophiala sideris]KAK5184876.1 hypothetical protein LTR44_002722 [Eurotiomycetes sp. CCFEE 6388]